MKSGSRKIKNIVMNIVTDTVRTLVTEKLGT